MIVLDTNVLSEIMRPSPSDIVKAWLSSKTRADLFTTTITQAEIISGLLLMPGGQRRDRLTVAARQLFGEWFLERVLVFDSDAAHAYGPIIAARRQAGHPIDPLDAQIAAIAASRGATLATRNVKDFQDCGIAVIDPWT